jgi:hypothetical protein
VLIQQAGPCFNLHPFPIPGLGWLVLVQQEHSVRVGRAGNRWFGAGRA